MKKLIAILSVLLLSVLIVACDGNGGNSEDLQDAYDRLLLDVSDTSNVTGMVALATELAHDTKATWTSSNEAIVSVVVLRGVTYAVVDQPLSGGNVAITLTAELKLGNQTMTKEFAITVQALSSDVVNLASIAALRALEIGGKDQPATLPIRMENVTVVGVDTDAYYITDGTDVTLVFTAPFDGLAVGDKGTIVGDAAIYYDAYQISNAGFVIKATDQPTPTKNIELSQYDFLDVDIATTEGKAEVKTAKNSSEYLGLLKFTALVVIRPDFTGGTNYQATLVGKTTGGEYDIDRNFVLSYYKGINHDKLGELNGQEVEITATVRELRDARALTVGVSKPVWSFAIHNITVKAAATEDTKLKADSAFALATSIYPTSGALTLPSEGAAFKSAITWALKDAADSSFVDLTAKTVTAQDGVRKNVVLVATITRGTLTVTKEFTITIGDYLTKSIAEFNQLAKDEVVRIKGAVVTSVGKSGNYRAAFLQDTTGAVYSYANDKAWDTYLVVGNELEIIAKKDLYNGQHQIIFIEVKVTGTNKTVNAVELAETDDFGAMQSKLVAVTGTITLDGGRYYINFGSAQLQLGAYGDTKTAVEALFESAKTSGKSITITASIVVSGSTGQYKTLTVYATSQIVEGE